MATGFGLVCVKFNW